MNSDLDWIAVRAVFQYKITEKNDDAMNKRMDAGNAGLLKYSDIHKASPNREPVHR